MNPMGRRLILKTDGACIGNPGPGGIGIVISDEDGVLEEISCFIGFTTNNKAEYIALIEGLRRAVALGCEEVIVYSDSELLCRQMKGIYKVRDPGIFELYKEALRLSKMFASFDIEHVSREGNREADSLANDAASLRPRWPKRHWQSRTSDPSEESPGSKGQGAG
jgi:ribonuclease HI